MNLKVHSTVACVLFVNVGTLSHLASLPVSLNLSECVAEKEVEHG